MKKETEVNSLSGEMKAMQRQLAMIIKILTKIVLVCILLTVCSCYKATDYLGQTANPTERIALTGSAISAGKESVWKTADVLIQYSVKEKDGGLTLSGHVDVADSVLNTFPIVSRFSIKVFLLDKNGIAVNYYDVTPRFSYHMYFPSRAPFSAQLPKEQGVTHIAFGYWGTFVEGDTPLRRRSGESWEVFHNPFSSK